MTKQRARFWLLLLIGVLLATAGCSNPRKIEHSVPSLVKILKEDKDPNMRYYAVEALGKFGPEAKTAAPDLAAALKDENKMVRMGAAYALGEIGATDEATALQEATKDSEKDVRDAATRALKQLQQTGKKR